ncbi:MAG: hypothetical protein K9L59_17830 [Desulfobacterales bacterium]|nr:hypothetical protein [Desulfobacterales bacterium]
MKSRPQKETLTASEKLKDSAINGIADFAPCALKKNKSAQRFYWRRLRRRDQAGRKSYEALQQVAGYLGKGE